MPEEYEEMTCFHCVQKHPFLRLYAIHEKEQPPSALLSESIVGREHEQDEDNRENECGRKRLRLDRSSNYSTGDVKPFSCHLLNLIANSDLKVKNPYQFDLEDLALTNGPESSSVFWSSGWRERLCSCNCCKVSQHNDTFNLYG